MQHNLATVNATSAHGFSCQTKVEVNEFGHRVLHIMGPSQTGAEEVYRLENGGERVTRLAKSCFTYPDKDGYDACHRLRKQAYSVALMPADVLPETMECTLENLKMYGMSQFGYGEPVAGLLPAVLEHIPIMEMLESRLDYFCALHKAILTHDGKANTLFSHLRDAERWVSAYLYRPDSCVGRSGAIIFPTTPIHQSS